MLISLANLDPAMDIWTTLAVLSLIAVIMTVLVYGVVALLVKIDDVGLKMETSDSRQVRRAGARIVRSMPAVFRVISVVGTVAMLWVGGHLVMVNLGEVGLHFTADLLHGVEHALEPLGGVIVWLGDTLVSAIAGLILGLAVVGVILGIGRIIGKRPSFSEGGESPDHSGGAPAKK
jgi:predicted DNA repair protein MutK